MYCRRSQPGRPDEQKLSVLTSVRSSLHTFIYRPADKFDDIGALLGERLEVDDLPRAPQPPPVEARGSVVEDGGHLRGQLGDALEVEDVVEELEDCPLASESEPLGA